jgi:hypothetical protein
MNLVSHSLTTLTRFGAYYDAIPKEDSEKLLLLAKTKLLNCDEHISKSSLTPEGILACLSVRFALEFDLSSPSTKLVQATQVERHLQICLAASPGLDTLLTVAGSEPNLAKAATQLINLSGQSAARLLAWHKELNCIDRGQRGELVALLLVMQARDIAAQNVGTNGWVYVKDFMKALTSPNSHQELFEAIPSRYCQTEQNTTLEVTFEDSKIWFNHVIKIEHGEMIHASHLWKFVSRGAMILCPPGHYGVDIILPVCFKGNVLARNNMTAIRIQVKNAKRFQTKISGGLFNHMSPFDVGLFSKGDSPLPTIRMVFALASDESGITLAPQATRHHRHNFTTYDIWCAGISPVTFGCIGDDQSSYTYLLQRSLDVNQAYTLVDISPGYFDKNSISQRGAARRRVRTLVGPQKEHSYKYRMKKD